MSDMGYGNTGLRSLGLAGLTGLLVLALPGCKPGGPAPGAKPPQVTVARPLAREVTDWDDIAHSQTRPA